MPLTREQMALRALHELEDGWVVNLGLGIPTLIANLLPEHREVYLHAENGLLGFGSYAAADEGDADVVNAGGQPVTLQPGASFFDSAESFAIVRGGWLDAAVLGGMQVAENGDLANWMTPARGLGGIGGAMDIAAGARRVIVLMEHTTRDGEPKLLRRCTYPLTAPGVVNRVSTDVAVRAITDAGFELRELAPDAGVGEVRNRTGAPLRVAPDLCEARL